MFRELPFLERFEAAAGVGFEGVEFPTPYEHPAEVIADLLDRHGLTNVLFNFPAGDWTAGERGIAALPGRESEFRDSVELAISYAVPLKTSRLHVLSGIVPTEDRRAEYSEVYLQNLRYSADRAALHDITLLVEAINPIDMPNYLVQSQAASFDICAAAGKDNVRMQLDLYHTLMTGDGLAETLRNYRTTFSHVQIAGVPGRNEPNVGEIDYPYLFDLLDELGYDSWVGCEYKPVGNTLDGLGWYRRQSR
jgi:hydroxypyruvate isomerase